MLGACLHKVHCNRLHQVWLSNISAYVRRSIKSIDLFLNNKKGNKETWGSVGCLLLWLWCWYHGCLRMSKHQMIYTKYVYVNMYVSYTWINVEKIKKEHKLTSEETLRSVRYNFFFSLIKGSETSCF